MRKMGANWTDQQLDAITSENRALFLSAAAGSGKTAVLIEKLTRMLCDPDKGAAADSIAVATFTNDAAAQMKRRLADAMSAKLEENPDNAYIAQQLSLIPSAKISTIHSFCFDLIRENSGLAGVDPSFTVLAEDDSDIIAAKAKENVFSRYFSEKQDIITELTEFFCPNDKNTDKFSEIAAEVTKKVLTQPFPEKYMDSITAMYSEPADDISHPLVKLFCQTALDDIQRAAYLLRKAVGVMFLKDNSITAAMSSYVKEYMAVKRLALRLKRDPAYLIGNSVTINICDADKDVPAALIPRIPGKKAADPELKAAVKFMRKQADRLCSAYCYNSSGKTPLSRFTQQHINDDFKVHAHICSLLFGLVKDILAEDRRLKDEKNGLGFSDAEQIALTLLCDEDTEGKPIPSALAKELADKFSIVMIDEFQDSSYVQELIFRMISKGGTADKPGTDFFAVGDVKQSIYRFRSAEPSIFLNNLKNSLPYSNDTSTEPARILLNKNFRSSRNVINTVNRVFYSLMSESCGGIDYGKNDRLICGGLERDDFGPTEFIDVSLSQNSTKNEVHIRAEAEAIAEKISSMLKMSFTEENDGRGILPSDFAILSREKKYLHIYAQALAQKGISSVTSTKEKYIDDPRITTVLDLLRVLDNPKLDIPMTAVLMSPMFMLTAEDMGRIRTMRQSGVYADIRAVCDDDTDKTIFPEGFVQRCSAFLDTFDDIRKFSVSHSIEELIRYIYDKTDYLSAAAVMPDGERSADILRQLPVFAAGYDTSGTGGLSGFVRQIDSMYRSGKDFSRNDRPTGSANAVSIQTIHGSKGLEYPFVFVSTVWPEFRDSENESITFCSRYGISFPITVRDSDTGELKKYRSFPERAMLSVVRKNAVDEEMMIFYVALTRARNKLFITRRASKAALEKRKAMELLKADSLKQDMAVLTAESYGQWLDIVYTPDTCRLLCSGGKLSRPRLEITAYQAQENSDSSNSSAITAEADEELMKKYDELIHSEYDYTLSKTSAKLTVTELAKSHDRQPVFTPPAEKDSTQEQPRKTGMSASERGTAVHAFMQYADLSAVSKQDNLNSAVRKEAYRLARTGVITNAQAECIFAPAVKAFLESSLFERMARSAEIIRERKFLVKISDLCLDDDDLIVYNDSEGMLQGVADCLFCEADGYVLVDYKTDSFVTEEELVQRYRRQLHLYAGAFSIILDKPVKQAYIYSFSLGKEIEIDGI